MTLPRRSYGQLNCNPTAAWKHYFPRTWKMNPGELAPLSISALSSLELEFLVVAHEGKRNETAFLISTARWSVGGIAASPHVRVLDSHTVHDIENMRVHRRSDSLALMGRVNRIQPDLPGLTVRAHFIV